MFVFKRNKIQRTFIVPKPLHAAFSAMDAHENYVRFRLYFVEVQAKMLHYGVCNVRKHYTAESSKQILFSNEEHERRRGTRKICY